VVWLHLSAIVDRTQNDTGTLLTT